MSDVVASDLIVSFDAFELDPHRFELRHAGNVIRVDPLAVRLLSALVVRAGELVSKEELFERVWGGRAVSDNVLTVAMARLRSSLKQAGGELEYIRNVFGCGYRFVRPVVRREAKLEPIEAAVPAAVSGGPMVGREGVLLKLHSILTEVRSSRGRVFIVAGEAGIGKTRTVEEFTRRCAASEMPVSWAYCRERGASPPLWPFAQLVRGVLAKRGLERRQARVQAALRELGRLVPELDTGGTLVDAEANGSWRGQFDLAAKHRLFDAVTQLLLMSAGSKGGVLVIEDVHRADHATLELLSYVIDEIAHSPLLVLLTLRTPLDRSVSPVLNALLTHQTCAYATLERLSEQDVGEYMAATLGEHAPKLAQSVFAKSEGNPFFMRELVRQIHESPNRQFTALMASKAARELARQRLIDLDDVTLEVLSCAAVIGRSFELPLLQIVSGLDTAVLMSSLESAWSRDVLVAAPDSRSAFTFDHDLLRDALYERLAPAKRRALHDAVVRAHEQRAHAVDACTLAHHAHAALPETDLRACVDHCIAAAEESVRTYAYMDGARYLGHAREALDLLPQGSPRLRLKLMFGQALYLRAHSSSDFPRLAGEVMRLARRQGDAVTLARSVLLLDLHPGFPPMPGARAALDEALAMLTAEQHGLRAALLARSATSAPEAFDAEQSARLVADALALATEVHSPLARYVGLSAQLYLRGGPLHRAEAAAYVRELDAMFVKHPRLYSLPPVLLELHCAIVAQQDGALLTQDAALLRCEKLAATIGARELLWHSQRFQAIALVNAGAVERGRAALAELHRRAEQEDLSGHQLLCAYDRAVVFRDGSSGMTDAQQAALALDPADSPSVWSIKARVLAAIGARREAQLALAMRPAEELARLPCDRDYLGTLGALAHAAVGVGALEYVSVLYELLAPYPNSFAAHIAFYCEGSVSQLRGMLARPLGREALALEQLEQGIGLCEGAGLQRCAEEARQELNSLRALRR